MAIKKEYQKPVIVYDCFKLSQSIAGNCEGIANFAESVCSVTVDIGFPIEIFQQEGICKWTGPEVDDMVCYHVPSDMNNVFTS